MKRTTLFVALASAFSLSAFAHGQQQTGAQSDQSSSYQQSANHQTQSPDIVKQVQQKLSENGQNVGQPDGKMGPKTQAALKQFQQQNGLQPTGQIDAKTLAALNIGQSGSATGGTASPSQGGASGSSSGSSNEGSGGASSNDTGSNDTGSNSSSSGSNR